MANDVVIRAERLGKMYVIGHEAERKGYASYVALRDVLAHAAQNAWRKTFDMASGRAVVSGDTIEEFWALKDVNFEVQRGEVIGVIGRNGAGKSTLLKVLSRITEPTEGRVTIEGRVASLLEVGTGFHPELSGRENIYLNGAILGMTRAEIRRKFDEIVDFAEIERFLDTPVKRYSSGMYVRLAFAVAAHLEPEILVVDEVLAVGDADFQKKCLGKMSDVANQGRTVLFVSHNMAALRALCPKSIYLISGQVRNVGATDEVVQDYLNFASKGPAKPGGVAAKVQHGLDLKNVHFDRSVVQSGEHIEMTFAFLADVPGKMNECAILIYSANETRVAVIDVRESCVMPFNYLPGNMNIGIHIKELPLIEGDYEVGLYLVTGEFCGDILNLGTFSVAGRYRSAGFVPYPIHVRGMVALNATATVSREPC